MASSKYLLSALVILTMGLSACAKKDSGFAERYAKNRLGAQVADGVKTQAAAENAAAQGLEADILKIQRTQSGSGIAVSALILINNQQVPVTTTHYDTQAINGTVNMGTYQIQYHALCGNESCNPYYAAMEVYQNGRIIIQEGLKYYFERTSSEHRDVYQWFSPGEELPLVGSSANDVNGMVGYLNSSNVSAGSATIIK